MVGWAEMLGLRRGAGVLIEKRLSDVWLLVVNWAFNDIQGI